MCTGLVHRNWNRKSTSCIHNMNTASFIYKVYSQIKPNFASQFLSSNLNIWSCLKRVQYPSLPQERVQYQASWFSIIRAPVEVSQWPCWSFQIPSIHRSMWIVSINLNRVKDITSAQKKSQAISKIANINITKENNPFVLKHFWPINFTHPIVNWMELNNEICPCFYYY